MSKCVTIEELKQKLPSKKRYITQEAVDIINKSVNEPEFQGESLLQTAITYESVLQNNKVSIPEYLNAIRFCAYLISNKDNLVEAYKKTFHFRKFVEDRWDAKYTDATYKELTAAASRYRRSKLVVSILTMSQVPLDLLYAGQRYKALGVLAEIMETGRLDRDRINAAKELLAATKGPENMKIELDVGVKESSAIQQLNDQLALMATRQKTMLESGAASLDEYGSMKVKEEKDVLEGELINEN